MLHKPRVFFFHFTALHMRNKVSSTLCVGPIEYEELQLSSVNCGFPSYPVRSLTSVTELGVNLQHLPINRATKDAEWLNQSVHPGY
ncbi:unnamed protein product [Porites evermanni]|uniref:Uncharacterized protein n=1 Tax=Porites evermanni TaxID=104178 RepID=A0ABN8MJ18_9CNID|nr:unnamed protein product [Porites evermanni]